MWRRTIDPAPLSVFGDDSQIGFLTFALVPRPRSLGRRQQKQKGQQGRPRQYLVRADFDAHFTSTKKKKKQNAEKKRRS